MPTRRSKLSVRGAQDALSQGAPVRRFLDRLRELPAVRAGLERVLGGGPPEVLESVFRQDAAAKRAAQPRRPIRGVP